VQLTYKKKDSLTLAECYEKYYAFPHQRYEKENLNSMVTGNVFIRRNTFDEIGSFNAALLSGGDSEFSHRAVMNGYIIKYNPLCIVYHPAKNSLTELLQKRRRILGGKVFRDVYVDKKPKTASIFRILYKQLKRYAGELLSAFRIPVEKPVRHRACLILVITMIAASLIYESFTILITNRARRR
jgi:GT2 family glycosyltransferase